MKNKINQHKSEIQNLIHKWETELKYEKGEIIFDRAAWIDPLYRENTIDRLEQCIKDLKMLIK